MVRRAESRIHRLPHKRKDARLKVFATVPAGTSGYGGNARTWRADNRAVVGASLSPNIPIGPGTQTGRFRSWTER